MPAAIRVRPEAFFSPEEWAHLCAKSSWKGLALVLHCWLVIGGAMALGIIWPVLIPLVVVIVGNRQLGLFILMHEGAHGVLHPDRKINDWVARWLCGSDLHAYRPYHLQHHRFVQQSEDPDLVLSAPFPITRSSLRRKVIRDLTGQTFFKLRFGGPVAQLKARLTARGPGEPAWPIVKAELAAQRFFLVANTAAFAVFAMAGYGWAWVLMWLLPMATWLQLITRLRNIAEHALIEQNGADPFRHARTTRAGPVERFFLAPYWVNYHCEHHLFTQVPCWKLPVAHRILARKGVTARMELQDSYAAVLRIASGA
ncbi:MAG: fatty acid desaturase [Comamonadaceae bacterium]|nr:MAG: fatty acid desaturase [Comamonadaceae bacterium]